MSLLPPVENNPLLLQQIEDQNPVPAINNDNPEDEEYYVDDILRCRTCKGERQALVKWTGYTKPEWTSFSNIQETDALDRWEKKWGSAESCNGPKVCKKNKREGR